MSNRTLDNPSLPPLAAATDIPIYSLVKYSAGAYAIAGVTDRAVGVATRNVKQGEIMQPRRPSAGGMTCIASEDIAAGTRVIQAAGGKIKELPTSGGGTGILIGTTLADSAAADGDWVEIEPIAFGVDIDIHV